MEEVEHPASSGRSGLCLGASPSILATRWCSPPPTASESASRTPPAPQSPESRPAESRASDDRLKWSGPGAVPDRPQRPQDVLAGSDALCVALCSVESLMMLRAEHRHDVVPVLAVGRDVRCFESGCRWTSNAVNADERAASSVTHERGLASSLLLGGILATLGRTRGATGATRIADAVSRADQVDGHGWTSYDRGRSSERCGRRATVARLLGLRIRPNASVAAPSPPASEPQRRCFSTARAWRRPVDHRSSER